MSEATCAACDCPIEGDAIKVKIGGQVVEVCCEECAKNLAASVDSARSGSSSE